MAIPAYNQTWPKGVQSKPPAPHRPSEAFYGGGGKFLRFLREFSGKFQEFSVILGNFPVIFNFQSRLTQAEQYSPKPLSSDRVNIVGLFLGVFYSHSSFVNIFCQNFHRALREVKAP